MTKVRVVLYVRVSTEEQAEHGYSIAAQIEALRQYAESQGWETVATYVDEGLSAKNMDRPALQAMLKAVRTKKVDTVLVWRANRLTRNLRDLTTMLEEFHKHDVSLVSHMEHFDLSTPTGRAMLQVAGVFAELERNNLAENVLLGQRKKARQGGWNGGKVYGYDNTPEGLKINPVEAAVVRRICNWYVEGKGAITICNLLNTEGIKTKKGGQWYVQGVMTILDNPVYAGNVRYGVMKNWAEKRRAGRQDDPIIAHGQHEPLISEEQWDMVQAFRQQRSAKPVKHHGHYILSGLLRCPACGSKMVGWHMTNKGRLHRYYKCGAFNSKGKSVCRGNYVNADVAEREVLSRLARILPNPQMVTDLVARLNHELGERSGPMREEVETAVQQIAQIERRMDNLIRAVEEGTLASHQVQRRMADLEQELAAHHSRKQTLEQGLEQVTDEAVSADLVRDALARFHETLTQADPDLQKRLLKTLIEQITVTNERVVDQVLLAFDPLSLLCTLEAETAATSSVTFNDDTVRPG